VLAADTERTRNETTLDRSTMTMAIPSLRHRERPVRQAPGKDVMTLWDLEWPGLLVTATLTCNLAVWATVSAIRALIRSGQGQAQRLRSKRFSQRSASAKASTTAPTI
jgi:hypothetical protein